jgi:hypothetical protein
VEPQNLDSLDADFAKNIGSVVLVVFTGATAFAVERIEDTKAEAGNPHCFW